MKYIKIKSIKECGYADVYNMEVEDTHNYSIEGGLVSHNCSPFEIPEHWIKWSSVDNGLNDPFCWFKAALSEDGTTYLYYEYTRDKKDPKIYYTDQAEKFMKDCKIDITEQTKQEIDSYHMGYDTYGIEEYTYEKLKYVIFGADAFNKDTAKGTGKSLLDMYKSAGFNYPTVRAVTDRKLGKDTIHEYLKPIDDGTGKMTAKLQIFSTCKHVINHLPKLVVEDNNPNVIAGNSAIDNTADCLKYLLIGSPRNNPQAISEPETEIERFKKEKIKAMKRRKNRKGILN